MGCAAQGPSAATTLEGAFDALMTCIRDEARSGCIISRLKPEVLHLMRGAWFAKYVRVQAERERDLQAASVTPYPRMHVWHTVCCPLWRDLQRGSDPC
jgi:hypothetical protein